MPKKKKKIHRVESQAKAKQRRPTKACEMKEKLNDEGMEEGEEDNDKHKDTKEEKKKSSVTKEDKEDEDNNR